MADSNAVLISKAFELEIKALQAVAASDAAGGGVTRDVRERLLESVFLNGVTAFEAFLERLFLSAVTGAIRTGGTKPVVSFRSEEVAWQILLGPRDRYLSWLPYSDTLERAQAYLVGGLPFSRVRGRARLLSTLATIHAVRNVIAHRSSFAKTKFDSIVGGRFPSAGAYLDAQSGGDRMCEAFLADFARIARGLSATTDVAVIAELGPLDPLPSGTKVDAGTFECVVCATRLVVPLGSTDAIACATCDPPCPTCGRVGRTASFRRIP